MIRHVVGDHSAEPVLSEAEGLVIDGGRQARSEWSLDFARDDIGRDVVGRYDVFGRYDVVGRYNG